ncbi:MAG: aldehyde dehydrogenase family protein [Phycisphaerae bacterium]
MKLRETCPLYLAGRPVARDATIVVDDKHRAVPATRVARAGAADVEAAIANAHAACDELRARPAYARADVLEHVVRRLEARRDEFAHVLVVEAGKLPAEALGEVGRAIDTFRIASGEATRIVGELLPLDISPRAARCEALVRRFPIGACAFITPFNFPLNLVAHKVAPALAAGCPWVLKPATRTPVCALLLGEILAETDLPPMSYSILPCEPEVAAPLVTDERIQLLSFTGSPAVGWDLKRRAGKKRVALELGGNAACIVDRDVDLDRAAERITIGAFYQAGQSCISVQRVFAHRAVYDALRGRLVALASKLALGPPDDERTRLGPLISESDARRVEEWVSHAVAAGARVLVGGRRHGSAYEATWLENVDPRQRVSCQEVFGPVALLAPFDEFEQALAAANDSAFGLQAGVFTRDLAHAFAAFERLDVGGVIINDVPSFRVDSMPYGGVKDSGFGREGVRYAIEEMTERKVMVLNHDAH